MIDRRALPGGIGAAAMKPEPTPSRSRLGRISYRAATVRESVSCHVRFRDGEAEFVSVTMAPGPGYAPHYHNGFVLGYVVDGAFRFAIEGRPERVLHAGEAF